jgi:hypothetical protein
VVCILCHFQCVSLRYHLYCRTIRRKHLPVRQKKIPIRHILGASLQLFNSPVQVPCLISPTIRTILRLLLPLSGLPLAPSQPSLQRASSQLVPVPVPVPVQIRMAPHRPVLKLHKLMLTAPHSTSLLDQWRRLPWSRQLLYFFITSLPSKHCPQIPFSHSLHTSLFSHLPIGVFPLDVGYSKSWKYLIHCLYLTLSETGARCCQQTKTRLLFSAITYSGRVLSLINFSRTCSTQFRLYFIIYSS